VTKTQKRKTEVEVQILIFNVLQKRKNKNGNETSAVQNCGKTKMEFGIPFSHAVGKWEH